MILCYVIVLDLGFCFAVDMISVRILTAETTTPIFIDQLHAVRNGFQNYLNLVHLRLRDEAVADIIRVLNRAVTQVKVLRVSDLTFRHVSNG